jgi:hypothetical protein
MTYPSSHGISSVIQLRDDFEGAIVMSSDGFVEKIYMSDLERKKYHRLSKISLNT